MRSSNPLKNASERLARIAASAARMNDIPFTPAFVERGYNNRAAVPDHPQWFAKFAALSAQARDRYAPKLDLRYGPGPKETLDLFVPASPARGTFVFIHGGYWRALDKADHLFVAGPFVERGYAVAVVNYDLCPDVTIATIVDECRRAVAWLAREGEAHGASAARVVDIRPAATLPRCSSPRRPAHSGSSDIPSTRR